MDWISIVFITTIIIFIIIGIIKGFARSVIDVAGELILLLSSCLLIKPISMIIEKIDIFINLKNTIYSNLLNINHLFGESFSKNNPEEISKALQELNIPELLNTLLTKQIINLISDNSNFILGEILSSLLLKIGITIICFIVIYLILKIVLIIVKIIIKKLIKSIKPIKKIDKFLGATLGLFVGIIVTNVLCLLITTIIGIPLFENINNIIINEMCLNNDTFTLSKFIYEHNLLLFLITLIL